MNGKHWQWTPPSVPGAKVPNWRERAHVRASRFFHSGEWTGHTLYLCMVGIEGYGKYYALVAVALVTLRLCMLVISPADLSE